MPVCICLWLYRHGMWAIPTSGNQTRVLHWMDFYFLCNFFFFFDLAFVPSSKHFKKLIARGKIDTLCFHDDTFLTRFLEELEMVQKSGKISLYKALEVKHSTLDI